MALAIKRASTDTTKARSSAPKVSHTGGPSGAEVSKRLNCWSTFAPFPTRGLAGGSESTQQSVDHGTGVEQLHDIGDERWTVIVDGGA